MLFVEDRDYEAATADDLLRLIPEHTEHPVLALVDTEAMTSPGRPLLIVDLNPFETRGAMFRALPAKLNGIAVGVGDRVRDRADLAWMPSRQSG